jgi:hypothetical protein
MANKAAWLTAAQVMPFKVDDAPMPVPEADKVVIRNRAVAINPVDWAMQAMGIGIIVQSVLKIERYHVIRIPITLKLYNLVTRIPISFILRLNRSSLNTLSLRLCF